MVKIKPGTVEASETNELDENTKRVMDCQSVEELQLVYDDVMAKLDELIEKQEAEPNLDLMDKMDDLATALDLAIKHKSVLEMARFEREAKEQARTAAEAKRATVYLEKDRKKEPKLGKSCRREHGSELEKTVGAFFFNEKRFDFYICFKFANSSVNFDERMICWDVEFLLKRFRNLRIVICYNYQSSGFQSTDFLDFNTDFSATIPLSDLRQDIFKDLISADWRSDSIRIFVVVHENQYSDLLDVLTNTDDMQLFDSFNIQIQNYMVFSSKSNRNRFSANFFELADCRMVLENSFVSGLMVNRNEIYTNNAFLRMKRYVICSKSEFDYVLSPSSHSQVDMNLSPKSVWFDHSHDNSKYTFKSTGKWQTLCKGITFYEFKSQQRLLFGLCSNATYVWAEVVDSVSTAEQIQRIHLVARGFTDKFNRLLSSTTHHLFTSDVWYERCQDQKLWLVNEAVSSPAPSGHSGSVCQDETIMKQATQAFSHFTYQDSNGEMVIFDLKTLKESNGGHLLTEPVIFSSIFGQYTSADLGPRGLEQFTQTHQCNSLCYQLKLFRLN